MSEEELKLIADKADIIVKWYAFTRKDKFISILNLKHPDHAMLISEEGKMLETNMDSIEQALVLKIWEQDSQFMEQKIA